MAAKSPYSPELRRRAVRMVGEVRPQYPTEWAAITAVGVVRRRWRRASRER